MDFCSRFAGRHLSTCLARTFWEPMRGVDHLGIFSEFLRTDFYRYFFATLDFVRSHNR
jgi:hypothetical protein